MGTGGTAIANVPTKNGGAAFRPSAMWMRSRLVSDESPPGALNYRIDDDAINISSLWLSGMGRGAVAGVLISTITWTFGPVTVTRTGLPDSAIPAKSAVVASPSVVTARSKIFRFS